MNEGVRYAENEFKLYTIQSAFVSASKAKIPVRAFCILLLLPCFTDICMAAHRVL